MIDVDPTHFRTVRRQALATSGDNWTIECCNVSKSFSGLLAVDSVSLDFEPGKITALVGPNGAGKTTLFHLICGSMRADEGIIRFRGEDIGSWPSWRVSRLGIGRLFQDIRIFPKLTALENLMVSFPNFRRESPFAAWFLRGSTRRMEEECRSKATRILDFIGLTDCRFQLAGSLSFGQQKLLALGRLLAADSRALMLDEPTAGLHPDMARKLLGVLRDLATRGSTIVLIEHNVSVVIGAADWLYFMENGQISAFGLPAEVLGDSTVRARYLGL